MLVTYNTIKAAEKARQPWTHRLVFKGWDAKRQRHSDKWWTISGDGSGSVAVNFGRAGSNGRNNPFRYSLQEGLKRLNDKRAKGYDVAPGHTDFREVPAERPLEGPYAAIRRIAFGRSPQDPFSGIPRGSSCTRRRTRRGSASPPSLRRVPRVFSPGRR